MEICQVLLLYDCNMSWIATNVIVSNSICYSLSCNDYRISVHELPRQTYEFCLEQILNLYFGLDIVIWRTIKVGIVML